MLNDVLEFRITGIIQENKYAKTYELQLLDGSELKFRPGQFLTFIIKPEKQELRRSYSILSLPGEPVKVTVKRVENGAMSRFILDNWQEGNIIQSLAPAGRFYVDPQINKSRDIFCFAAGSGIIPIWPQIRWLLNTEPQSIIHLVYSNRNEADALFLEEIEGTVRQFPQLNLINLFSEPIQQHHNQGRLSNLSAEVLISEQVKFDRHDSVFLLCGPFAYMRMLVFTIGLMGFRKENIKRENYVPEAMNAGFQPPKVFPDTTILINHRQGAVSVTVPSGETILTAALKAEINVPFSCKGGVCGSCAAKCHKGKVYMSINEVLTETDLKEGWVLTCTGYPEEENTVVNFNID